jgi:adenylate cyclase
LAQFGLRYTGLKHLFVSAVSPQTQECVVAQVAGDVGPCGASSVRGAGGLTSTDRFIILHGHGSAMERRLAAILAADVVGYSRLVEKDEAGTLAALASRRKAILEPLLAKYRGRVVRLMGDGTLLEFASAVDAVHCAVDIQRTMKEANAQLSDDRAIVLRIGMNLGDVVVEDGDLYGDGVNIAARLEAMADPGGIYLSAAMHQQVERLLPFAFRDLGDRALKNIARPVRVYCIAEDQGEERAPSTGTSTGRTFSLPSKPSVAVLPFANLSGDPEQQYFSDGITEDITTDLSRFRQLFVIARHSSFQYRDAALDVKRVGRELGVEYVVEGSVRRIGERVRITAQLIDAITGNHLWAERYDRDLKEIFSVQDDVVHTIVAILPGRIEEAGSRSARRKRPENLAAYDYFLRGSEYHLMFDTAHNAVAREMFEKSIALDPDLAPAYAWLATQHMRDWMLDQSVEAREQAFKLAERSIALDPNDSVCHMMFGYVCFYKKQFEEAEFHLNRAISLNPNDPNNAVTMGWFCACLGRPDEGLNWLDKAYRLNPYPPPWYHSIRGTVLYAARRYTEAVAALKRVAASLEPWDVTYLAASYGQLGSASEAQALVAKMRSLYPKFCVFRYVAAEPFRKADDIANLRDGLSKAGLHE